MTKLYDVHQDAKIGINVKIESFAKIHEDVVIGDNCTIGSGVVIYPGTRIGDNTSVFPGAVLGAAPQDLKYNGEKTTLEIGSNVIIREYCTLNRGTSANNMTKVGNNCLLMAYVHVGHDCIIGNNCILANNTTLGGHIEIDDFARIGGMTAIHQFCRIGKYTMLQGGSLVGKDVPPYTKAARFPLSYAGVNSIGLKRAGYSYEDIHHIQDIYRVLYVRGNNVKQGQAIIEAEIDVSPFKDEILEFIETSNRGIMRGFRSSNANKSK